VPFIDQLISTFGDASETVVLVGHNGIYRCMLPLVLKGIDFDFVTGHSLSSTGYVLAEKRAEYVEALVALHQARAGVERLIAAPLPSVDSGPLDRNTQRGQEVQIMPILR